MDEKLKHLVEILEAKAVDVGGKILAAVLLWVLGRFVIARLARIIEKSLSHRKTEATLVAYLDSTVRILLTICLVLAILGTLGVETTTFAGALAAAGVAIGMAWSGLLANFAAGALMIVLRPFKKGDFVTIGNGITGTVREIGLFTTTLNTPDNVLTTVGNNKVFGETIQNFSANPYRRVDRTAQLAHGADVPKAIALLKERIASIPNVATEPSPDVTVLDFTLAGPVLAVRPYCHNDHYWQVYFDTNEAIRAELGAAGFAVPATQHFMREAA